jgi:MFS family permease
MGVVYFAFLLVYTLCMMPGGLFIDRFGPRAALLVMGFGSAFFVALTGVVGAKAAGAAQLLMALIVVRSLMGMMTVPLHPACARVVANWIPASRVSWANGLVTFAAVVGVASTYKLFGMLIDLVDWPMAFGIAAATTVLLTAIWAVRGADRPQTPPSTNGSAPAGVEARVSHGVTDFIGLFRRSLLLLTLSYSAVGYFQYLFFYWIHYYFKDILRLGSEESRFYSGLPTLALAIGMLVGGWLADRAQRRLGTRWGYCLVPMSGLSFGAVFLFLGVAASDPLWIVAYFTLSMGAVGVSESSFWQTAVQLGGHRGGTAAAILNTGGNGVGLLAPLLTPAISEHLGWQWGITLGGVVCFLGAICWCGIDPWQSADSSAPPSPYSASQ